MTQLHIATIDATSCSPLVLCDRLISLAQEADRAGQAETAGQLVELVMTMFDAPKKKARRVTH